MRLKIGIGMIITLALGGSAWFWVQSLEVPPRVSVIEDAPILLEAEHVERTVAPENLESLEKESIKAASATKRRIVMSVPFTVQAPYAEWSNPIFQDACEEASVIMAYAWISKTALTKESVKQDIEAMARWQKQHFGHAMDTSVDDTHRLLREFFSVDTAAVERAVTIEQMKAALAGGSILLAPTDGRLLKNPHFTQPGPERHMVVVIGYDDETDEFIVNDPGTRKGEGYRYPQAVLYEAMLDYPTGKHAPVTSTDKVMIVIGK